MTTTDETITLRPVVPSDREFLLQVYECSRATELEMVPWTADEKRAFVEHQFEAQSTYYASEFAGATHDIVILRETNAPAGRLYVNRSADLIAILDLTILPEFRCRGIGSSIVETIIAEAHESGRAVRVYVETFNSSQNFFLRRDFAVENNDGMNLRMVWRPRIRR